MALGCATFADSLTWRLFYMPEVCFQKQQKDLLKMFILGCFPLIGSSICKKCNFFFWTHFQNLEKTHTQPLCDKLYKIHKSTLKFSHHGRWDKRESQWMLKVWKIGMGSDFRAGNNVTSTNICNSITNIWVIENNHWRFLIEYTPDYANL